MPPDTNIAPPDSDLAVETSESHVKTKLITVHGTGAGDTTASGDRWWQLGSTFMAEFCKRIDIDPSQVELSPFQWEEGPNSEAGRRDASLLLFFELKDLDDAGTDYYLIGHSHGGSVIYNTLLQSVRFKTPLEGLKSWCTVGTPFLDFRLNSTIIQRLSGLSLAVLATGFVAFLLFICLWISVKIFGHYGTEFGFVHKFSFALLIYGLLSVAGLWLLERREKSWFTASQKKQVASLYSDRWLGFWHLEDEAISALANIRKVYVPIIKNDFLKPTVAILLLVLVAGGGVVLAGNTLLEGSWLERFGKWLIAYDPTIDEESIGYFAWMTVWMLGFYFLVILVLTILLNLVIRVLGVPLAAYLNGVFWAAVQRTTWGDDILKEDVREISTHPPEFPPRFDPLPDSIAAPLRAHSDHHAISTLNKVRVVLGMEGDRPPMAGFHSQLAETLNWQELIHTSYFDVPEFIDLLALGLNRAGLGTLKDGFSVDQSGVDRLEVWLESGSRPALATAAE